MKDRNRVFFACCLFNLLFGVATLTGATYHAEGLAQWVVGIGLTGFSINGIALLMLDNRKEKGVLKKGDTLSSTKNVKSGEK